MSRRGTKDKKEKKPLTRMDTMGKSTDSRTASTIYVDSTCPTCGQDVPLRCEWHGCQKLADYEGWVRGGGMVRRMCLCAEHIEESEGRKAGRPLPETASEDMR